MVMQVQDLSYLVQAMGNDPFSQRYRKLSQGLCEVWNNPVCTNTFPLPHATILLLSAVVAADNCMVCAMRCN